MNYSIDSGVLPQDNYNNGNDSEREGDEESNDRNKMNKKAN